MAGIAGRVDALWRLITAVVETAGVSVADDKSPPAEFTQALAAPRASHQSVRLNIDGKEWVAAISQDERPANPASAWAAIERITKAADHEESGR